MSCAQELCVNWTGQGCICAVLDTLPDFSIHLEGELIDWREPPDDQESPEDFTARVDAMQEEYPL